MSEKVAIGQAILEKEAAAAKGTPGHNGHDRSEKVRQTVATGDRSKAKAVGMSAPTFDTATAVIEATCI